MISFFLTSLASIYVSANPYLLPIFSPWITKIAWDTYNTDETDIAVHLGDFHPELFEKKPKKELKEDVLELYQKFKPSFFNNDLKRFLKGKVLSS